MTHEMLCCMVRVPLELQLQSGMGIEGKGVMTYTT